MVMYCCMFGCISNSQDQHRRFFRFPKDTERSRKWLRVSGRYDLVEKDLTHYRVCDLHFRQDDHLAKKLKRDAVPSQLLPEDFIDRSKSTQTEHTIPMRNSSVESFTQTTIKIVSDFWTQTTKAISGETTLKRKLMAEFQSQLKKQKLVESQQEHAAQRALNDLTPQLKRIIDLQKHLRPNSRGNKYDKSYKLFALKMYFSNPGAYKVLANLLSLPGERTLRRLKVDIGTKVCPNVVNSLQSKLAKLDESEKFCVISVGEMHLKRNLFHQINKDKIIGFQDIDGVQTAEPATRVLVVMARGIFSKWEQQLGYCFLTESIKYEELKIWLNDLISTILNIGYHVAAFVSDLDQTFLKLAEERIASPEEPYFCVGERKVYTIFDVPNLMKTLRNALLKYDFVFSDNVGNRMIAKWEHIHTFYQLDCPKPYRLAPKLTDSHINPNNFEKGKIEYATQTFSYTVAAALNNCIEFQWLTPEAYGTVKLIDLMNKTFDVMNSSVVKDTNQNKNAFASQTHQTEILNEFDNFLSAVTVLHENKDVTKTVTCLKAWKITVNSVRNIAKDFNLNGFRFLFTSRLNQDALRSFFDSVKQQGGNCGKSTPLQFIRAFNQSFMTNLLKVSDRSNYSDDFDGLLSDNTGLNTHDVFEEDIPETTAPTSLAVDTTDYRFDLPEKNAFLFVCGYLLKKCTDLHKCEKIIHYVSSNEKTDEFNFETSKSFGDKKQTVSINTPESFVACVKAMEGKFKHLLEEKILDSIGKHMFNALSDISVTECCECFPNTYLRKLFVRWRIFNTIKVNNRLYKKKISKSNTFCVDVFKTD